MTLGEKIKKARKEKKMTQSELAGDKITRNMLCQIELGIANPSLETVRYLSEKLSLPISYLFSDEDDLLFFKKKSSINEIYAKYKDKEYLQCISLVEALGGADDELSYILATSYLQLGKNALLGGSLQSAVKYFDFSLKCCDMTVLDTAHIKAVLPMYRAIASNIQAPLLEFDSGEYDTGLTSVFDFEMYKYLVQDYDYSFTNEKMIKHIKAKRLIKERNYPEAIQLLNEAAEMGLEHYNAFIMFGIYSDLEICYKQIYDFENAYRFSSKRLSMLEGFKS